MTGRLIIDNVIIAYEALHSMATRQIGRWGIMALKLDMSKAYDRIEWSFLKVVMNKMCLGEKWITLIMNCVTTISYGMLVNGQPGDNFQLTREIIQVDLISPYLFFLCVEGLSSLLDQAELESNIKEIKVAKGYHPISHLFFTDDSTLFC